MTIYYATFATVLAIGVLGSASRSRLIAAIATFVATLILWLVLALRAPSVGTDVASYVSGLEIARIVDVSSGSPIYNFEPGFTVYLGLLANAGFDAQAMLALTAAVTLVPVGTTVWRHSPMPVFSMFLYGTFGFYVFAFSGLRQAWAVALCFATFGLIKNRRLVPFLVVVLLASLLHLSAIVFVPAYWIYRVRAFKLEIPMGLVGLATVWTLRSPLYAAVFLLYRDRDAVFDQTGAITLFLILSSGWLGAAALDGRGDNDDNGQEVVGPRHFLYVAAAIQALASVSFLVGRVGQYYLIFIIILLPILITRQPDPTVRLIIATSSVAVGVIFFNFQADNYGLAPYSFSSDR